ncbi:MAG: serine/threonine protein phosphatase [Ruminococcus sp.]|nr:serine/threonine protein phosphatase [Ruminococcus sp.]MEE0857023.1 serine/threonine protein phosphatase [Ruminococcus sp.]
MIFKRNKRRAALAVQTVPKEKQDMSAFGFLGFEAQCRAERELYDRLREGVPVIDAAICKLVRLIGSFRIEAGNAAAQRAADELCREVKFNGSSFGLVNFIYDYLDSLLTYGTAVGEMIPDACGEGIAALYQASLDDVEIRADKTPLDLVVCAGTAGKSEPAKYQSLILASLLKPKPGTVRGTSLLSGLPFVCGILEKILVSLKHNWERAGDVRFVVTCNPQNGVFGEDDARKIADEWREAVRSDRVCDFVSVGDVSVKVIGAESEMPECETPVRVVLEQILGKLGIPPFLLGLSWSSTERMSTQQADILTSELEYYRAILDPVIRRIVKMHLRLLGLESSFRIVWNDINLQDTVELAQARLHNAQAEKIEQEIGVEYIDE